MSSIIGHFKAQSQVGRFKWESTKEAHTLRRKVEFVAKNPITNQSWHNYAELRALRELAYSIEAPLQSYSLNIRDTEATKEEEEYDKIWNKFCNSTNPDGSSKFGLARCVEQLVHAIDPWA